ncbi:MAG TPA: baseplate J/gp47 family protein [Bryobacteraceae bacterium]|nr:baseplate J/gp47 family protein [Bryobacteraceae bacterium]
MAVPDRLELLLAQTAVTGIDFVYVYPSQTTLDVYFLNSPVSIQGAVAAKDISIYSPSGGETLPVVPVANVFWSTANGRDVLRIITTAPGDFSRYRLHIENASVDRYYNDVWFSFKANCPSDLDCKTPPHVCPPDAQVDFPVDYTARDFWSFRQALLDFASQRYPKWKDRLEADAGNMLLEAMSALGDEFAYIQDRYARETYLETATQRRSIRRLASLVDYQITDGLAATTWLDFQMDADDTIAAGTQVSEPAGTIVFEVGRGLAESYPPEAPKLYNARAILNRFLPHIWTDTDECLPVGSTDIFIENHHAADILFDDTSSTPAGKWMLLQTNPTDPAVLARVWMVRVIAAEDTTDLVFGAPITHLTWEAAQATPFEMDMTFLEIHANLLPATAGATVLNNRFITGPSDDPADHPSSVERIGPDSSLIHRFSLPGSDQTPIAWLGDQPATAAPEVRLREVRKAGLSWVPVPNGTWDWRRALIGEVSAEPGDTVFTLDDGFWRRIVGYQRLGTEVVHRDYASNDGKTIRFGDNGFGLTPADGTIFETVFRLNNGTITNVAARTLTTMPAKPLSVATVTNPLAATGGVDPETTEHIQQNAPQQFRYLTYRAVRPEDYAEAAERLPWVQRAGASFRWTGSWTTAFVTPDPRGAFAMTPAQRTDLVNQIDRFRQAGRPAYVLNPKYATLDLQITICTATSSYRGDVEAAAFTVLFGSGGFFSPDNFTFGTPLERSELEAAIQRLSGVQAVEDILIRRRGWFDWRPFNELTFQVAKDEVIRVENNRLLPERGSVKLILEGGA